MDEQMTQSERESVAEEYALPFAPPAKIYGHDIRRAHLAGQAVGDERLKIATEALQKLSDTAWYICGYVPADNEQARHHILMNRINEIALAVTRALEQIQEIGK